MTGLGERNPAITVVNNWGMWLSFCLAIITIVVLLAYVGIQKVRENITTLHGNIDKVDARVTHYHPGG